MATGGGKLLNISRLQRLRKILEKVAVEGETYFVEEAGINTRTGENVIYITPVAMYLAAEPCDSPFLTTEFFLNNLTNENRRLAVNYICAVHHHLLIFLPGPVTGILTRYVAPTQESGHSRMTKKLSQTGCNRCNAV